MKFLDDQQSRELTTKREKKSLILAGKIKNEKKERDENVGCSQSPIFP